jgi:hypothetical protein
MLQSAVLPGQQPTPNMIKAIPAMLLITIPDLLEACVGHVYRT